MKITIFNLKGGQGKTTISLALALQYGFAIVTNDEYSPIDKVLKKGKVKHLEQSEELPQVPDKVKLIYDFGGHPDKRVIDAVKISNWVMIPVFYESPLDMQTTIKTIREIEAYNSNIIVVVNKTQKGDLEKAQKVLKQFFNYPIFEIKKSTSFVKMVEKKRSIRELMESSALFGYHYKAPLFQVEKIYNHIS